jgi:hypothetical protein
MKRMIFISSLLFLLVAGCYKDTRIEASNDIPEWLKVKTDSMSADRDYFGTKVYRYKWNNEYVYHIEIPISSCLYCELYDQRGTKIQLADNTQLQTFLNNRTDQVLVWEWAKEP